MAKYNVRLTVTRSMDIEGVEAESIEDVQAHIESAFSNNYLNERDLHYEFEYDGVFEMDEYYDDVEIEDPDDEEEDEG